MILTDASGASDVDGVGEGASSVHAARDATQSALANDRLYDEPSRRALSARIRTSPSGGRCDDGAMVQSAGRAVPVEARPGISVVCWATSAHYRSTNRAREHRARVVNERDDRAGLVCCYPFRSRAHLEGRIAVDLAIELAGRLPHLAATGKRSRKPGQVELHRQHDCLSPG